MKQDVGGSTTVIGEPTAILCLGGSYPTFSEISSNRCSLDTDAGYGDMSP